MSEINTFITGTRIEDAWRNVLWHCVKNGYDFVIKGGSYVGQIRKQLNQLAFVVREPWVRPLAPIMPSGLPPVTTDEKIEQYFVEYLMSAEVKENEEYTYGSYIAPQIQDVINILNTSRGNTNQATITIGDIASTKLPDPPCLRVLSFKVVEGKLQLSVFFRSWDAVAGLPENIGGFQLLKEYVLSNLDESLHIVDGPIVGYSDGLHIYSQYFDLVNVLNVDKINVSENVLKDQEQFCKKLNGE